jgi:hypothetical protein
MKDLYLIKWLDAYSNTDTSWIPNSSMKEPGSVVCLSVGWIGKENKKYITIIPHLCNVKGVEEDKYFCGEMTIPKGCIIKKVKLKKWY